MTHLYIGTKGRYYSPELHVAIPNGGIFSISGGSISLVDHYANEDLVFDPTYYSGEPYMINSVNGTGYSSEHYQTMLDEVTNQTYIVCQGRSPDKLKVLGVVA